MTSDIAPDATSALAKGNREVIADHYVRVDVKDELKLHKFKIYVRLNANRRRFKNVSFEHCVFEGCYFRDCVFDSCDFTGCKFVSCNFHHSSFADCKFEYVTFERSMVDADILSSAPKQENLRLRFARTLRMNFQQIGDAKAVNQAINMELEATARHLRESWFSEERYHREKYRGFKRIGQFLAWSEFWILHFVWGNGESIPKLVRSILIAMVVIALYDAVALRSDPTITDYWESLKIAPAVFLGTLARQHHSIVAVSVVVASRLIALSLLTALLVKRLGRR